jgi:hypothetical protein
MSREFLRYTRWQNREIVDYFIYRVACCNFKALFSIDEIDIILGFPVKAHEFI